MNHVTNSSTTRIPEIYVACLASYNNRILHGAWISLDQPLEDVLEQIKHMLEESPEPDAEEFGVHDFENFGCLPVDEDDSIKDLHERAQFILKHGELGVEVFAHYGSIKDAEETLSDYYMGEYESELDYAIHLFDECYSFNFPKRIKTYIDYDMFCRDIFANDYFSVEVNGRCHVFMFH